MISKRSRTYFGISTRKELDKYKFRNFISKFFLYSIFASFLLVILAILFYILLFIL